MLLLLSLEADSGPAYGLNPQKDTRYAANLFGRAKELSRDGVLVDELGKVREWKSIDDAARGVKSEFFHTCGDGREMVLMIFEKNNRFYVGSPHYGDATSVKADLSPIDPCCGGKLVGAIHNHPKRSWYEKEWFKSREYNNIDNAWPSVSDARVARKLKIDVFMMDCQSGLDGDESNDVILVVEGGKDCVVKKLPQNGDERETQRSRDQICDLANGHSYWNPSSVGKLDEILANERMECIANKENTKRTISEAKNPEDQGNSELTHNGEGNLWSNIDSRRGICYSKEFEVPVKALEVDSYKSDGGIVKVTAEFDDHRDINNEPISEWITSEPNTIKINNSLNRDVLSRKVDMFKAILHESRHKWNSENLNKVCNRLGKRECDLFDELTAFMSEGMTKEEALNHLLKKYPELTEAIEGYFGICAKPDNRNNTVKENLSTSRQKDEDVAISRASSDGSQVGVRGWCKCGAEHGKIHRAGGGGHWLLFISSASKASLLGDYQYRLCGRCWRLFKPKRSGDEAEIIDLRIERKYGELAGSRIPTYKYKELLKQAENKLLDIPDGEVVIPGTCSCKVPDPISNAGSLSDYVCILCGRVRLPDANGNMPQGPTALYAQGLEKFAESAEERMRQWLEKD